MVELLPGLHQIEVAMGDNRLCLYLLRGQRTLLVDSGARTTPETDIYPALAAAGLPERIDLLLVSHADADHHGGNAAVVARSPHTVILAHEADRRRIEAKACHLQERYTDVVAADDLGYPPEVMAWLADMIGEDTPVHLGLRGGETLRVDGGTRWEVLRTPGHTPGHLSLWEPERRVLIVQDAVLGRGVPDRRGQMPSPPPYYDVASYTDTIRRLQALQPEWLLTAHYSVLWGEAAAEFLIASLDFVERMDAALLDIMYSARRPLTLSAVIAAVDARLGPFAMRIQWIGPTLAHLGRHVADGLLRLSAVGAHRAWEAAN
jgi:glyoxylase-like metal-dependent hydrolase (beta-lactamase superfamily II)